MKCFRGSRIALGGAIAAAFLMSGCGNSDSFVHTNTNILQPPVAADDAVNALGNATLNQAAANGVLGNDVVNGAAITAFDAVGSNGGAINLNADGSFTYTPVFGFVGAETFTYTLANQAGNSTATVTLTSTGLGHFVDNTAAPGGDGSQANPFDTLAAAIATANNGDTIFVARGDGTNTGLAGAAILPAGVDLIGEGTGLILAQTIVPQGQAPSLTGPISCLGDNTVSGITFDGSIDNAIEASDVSDLTISNNTFRNATNEHVDLANIGGTVNITDNTLEPGADSEEYIDIDNLDTNATFNITGNTFTDDNTVDPDEAVDFDMNGTSVCTIAFSNNTVTSDDELNSFSDGFELDVSDTGQATVTANDNTFTRCGSDALDIDTDSSTASITATVSGNMISNNEDNCIEFDADFGTVTATVTGNVVTTAGGAGIDADADGNGSTMTVTIDNNNISNTAFEAIEIASPNDNNGGNGAAVATITNNTITNAGTFSILSEVHEDGSVCLDITGNTLENDLRCDESGTGVINVEQLDAGDGGPLSALNTFNNMADVQQAGNVNSVVDGFCTP